MSISNLRRHGSGVVRVWRNKVRLIKRKAHTLHALVKNGDWPGVAERFRRYAKRLGFGREAALQRDFLHRDPGFDILCTPHTRYVATLIARSLAARGIAPVSIFDSQPDSYSARLHIVVCPQMFDRLPACYIAFQMEQSVSSRWFDKTYLDKLERALAVMDYSRRNLAFLQEEGGLSYRQLFYTPISNLPKGTLPHAHLATDHHEYDIVFYGDANSPRRKRFIDALRKKYRVLCVSEVFGEALYRQLSRARLVVNIHYYEGALLETTRLYECLSLGLEVVSESSVDVDEHEVLMPWVTFTPIDDVEAMVHAVGQRLEAQASPVSRSLPSDIAHFDYYFTRMLVALDLVSASHLDALPAPLEVSELARGVGLSLPETHVRQRLFQEAFPDVSVFPGLRHVEGWRGCGLSYRYLARQALRSGLEVMEVREDDALLDDTDERRWHKACQVFDADPAYGILSGLLADLSDDVEVQDVFEKDGERYIVINRMMSMVCNRYARPVMELMAAWDPEEKCAERNTIDRYLERHEISVLVPLPFIARHRPDTHSTLWNFQNTTYDDMIAASEKRLLSLARDCRESASSGSHRPDA